MRMIDLANLILDSRAQNSGKRNLRPIEVQGLYVYRALILMKRIHVVRIPKNDNFMHGWSGP